MVQWDGWLGKLAPHHGQVQQACRSKVWLHSSLISCLHVRGTARQGQFKVVAGRPAWEISELDADSEWLSAGCSFWASDLQVTNHGGREF